MNRFGENYPRFAKEIFKPIKKGIRVLLITGMLMGPIQAAEAGNGNGSKHIPDGDKSTEILTDIPIPVNIDQDDQRQYPKEYLDIKQSTGELLTDYPFLSKFISRIDLKSELKYQDKPVFGLAYIYQAPNIIDMKTASTDPGYAAYLELSLADWRMANPDFSPDVKDRSVLLEEIGHLLDLSSDNILLRTAITPQEMSEIVSLRTKALDLYQQRGGKLLCNPYENPDLIDSDIYPDKLSIDKEVAAEGFQLLIMQKKPDFTTPYPRFFADLMLDQHHMDAEVVQAFVNYWQLLAQKLELHWG